MRCACALWLPSLAKMIGDLWSWRKIGRRCTRMSPSGWSSECSVRYCLKYWNGALLYSSVISLSSPGETGEMWLHSSVLGTWLSLKYLV